MYHVGYSCYLSTNVKSSKDSNDSLVITNHKNNEVSISPMIIHMRTK